MFYHHYVMAVEEARYRRIAREELVWQQARQEQELYVAAALASAYVVILVVGTAVNYIASKFSKK